MKREVKLDVGPVPFTTRQLRIAQLRLRITQEQLRAQDSSESVGSGLVAQDFEVLNSGLRTSGIGQPQLAARKVVLGV
ncbi:hypothetical protein COCOBI_19-2370 [Coccomyxa sp. Obi]|nr:hypothetical protein COCOBI_19-2370 [Coccomyxa sp. Obi]